MGIACRPFSALSGLLHPMHRSLSHPSRKNVSDKLICGQKSETLFTDLAMEDRFRDSLWGMSLPIFAH